MPVDAKRRYRDNRQGEIDSAFVYRAMSAAERNPQLASVYVRLAQVEERHLIFWEERLRSVGVDPQARGETLTIGQYVALSNAVAESH